MIVPPVIATLLAACVAMVPSPSVALRSSVGVVCQSPPPAVKVASAAVPEPVKYGRRSAARSGRPSNGSSVVSLNIGADDDRDWSAPPMRCSIGPAKSATP